MSKYGDRHFEIDLNAPVKWVTPGEFNELWLGLEAEDRFGHFELSGHGYEAIWDYENKRWLGIKS